MKKYGILITTFNRYDYYKTTADSLKRCDLLPGTKIFINDDCSSDPRIKEVSLDLQNYFKDYDVRLFTNEQNLGAQRNYRQSMLKFENEDVDYVINIDADCIFNKFWMKYLDQVISLFDYDVCANAFMGNLFHTVIFQNENYIETKTSNGLGVTLPRSMMGVFKDMPDTNASPFDGFVYAECRKRNIKAVSPTNSYIEHIGYDGVNSMPNHLEKAVRFVYE